MLCATLSGPVATSLANEVDRLAPVAVAQFYAGRSDAPAWSDDRQFNDFIRAIEGLSDHGLTPEHYHLQALRSQSKMPEQREKLATDAWFSAAAHMVFGKLDPLTYEPNWTAARRQRDLSKHLTAALTSNSVASSLDALAPDFAEYVQLKSELARLRQQQEVAIRVIPEGPALKFGMTGARVEALQARLRQLDLMPAAAVSGIYDQATLHAVRVFQDAAGLDGDGIVGPVTLTSLNRDVQGKINQISINLERWRWLPESLGRRHVRVNIADFSVALYNQEQRERTHLSIIGQRYRKTPVFSDQIEYVILNPWWETPDSLARKDKLPMFQQDPTAVERLGFQVLDRSGQLVPPNSVDWALLSVNNFPYRIRQAPGPLNALGQIKIMFPNKHNVYLHDTPTRGLFTERQRAFSSGCIRVQNPVDLAAWLFQETPGWDKARFDAAISTGKETRVNLKSPIPVHILYFTVSVDSSGTARYLDDIYQRDQLVLRSLVEPST